MTIFHLEQALEMSVKGLARASGYPHKDLKGEVGHDYADLYISLLENVLGDVGVADLLNDVLSVFYTEGPAYDASVHLSNVRDHLASPRSARAKLTDADWRGIFLSAFRMSVEDVDRLIKVYDSVSRDQAIAYGGLLVLKAQMALELGVSEDAISPSELNKEFEARFPSLRPLIGLFIFGCVFWPHYAPSRYPAPPEAESDVFQVAHFSSMGVSHYTDDLGVVKRLKTLLECCEEIVDDLIQGHRRGHWFMTKGDIEFV